MPKGVLFLFYQKRVVMLGAFIKDGPDLSHYLLNKFHGNKFCYEKTIYNKFVFVNLYKYICA